MNNEHAALRARLAVLDEVERKVRARCLDAEIAMGSTDYCDGVIAERDAFLALLPPVPGAPEAEGDASDR